MLKRKAAAAKSPSHTKRSSSPKAPKLKAPPVRRRFVISSKALKLDPASPVPPTPPPAKAAAPKLPANGQAPMPAPAGATPLVDLTETIKTLLHLSQEHGYITYDDINDILPDNLSPDDLDALLSKLRGLDVEIVMDQAEAERAERGNKPQQPEEVEDDSR